MGMPGSDVAHHSKPQIWRSAKNLTVGPTHTGHMDSPGVKGFHHIIASSMN